MDKILFAKGIGERQFDEKTAAALLSMHNPQWVFVRNVTPSNVDNNAGTGKAENNPKPSGEGSSIASTGKGEATRKARTGKKSRDK